MSTTTATTQVKSQVPFMVLSKSTTPQPPAPPKKLQRMVVNLKDRKLNPDLSFEIATSSKEKALAFAKFFNPEFKKYNESDLAVKAIEPLHNISRQFGICQFVTTDPKTQNSLVHYCLLDKNMNVVKCSKSMDAIMKEYQLSTRLVFIVSNKMFLNPLRYVPYEKNGEYRVYDTLLDEVGEEVLHSKPMFTIGQTKKIFEFPKELREKCLELNSKDNYPLSA